MRDEYPTYDETGVDGIGGGEFGRGEDGAKGIESLSSIAALSRLSSGDAAPSVAGAGTNKPLLSAV